MGLTISQKADALGTFRFVCVRAMETLAEWVPTSPELEVKTLFGRHIWSLAQHADRIGRRTVELRAKLHYQRPPHAGYLDALQLVRRTSGSGNRVAAFYDALLPDLARRFADHLAASDELLDAPTIEIIRHLLVDFDGMRSDRQKLATMRADVAPDSGWADQIRRAFADCDQLVDHREPVAS